MVDNSDLEEIEGHLNVLRRSEPASAAEEYDPIEAELEVEAFPQLVAVLGRQGMPEGPNQRDALESIARELIEKRVGQRKLQISLGGIGRVARRIALDVLGTGPLQEYLDDPRVSEIMVNGPQEVLVERNGRIERTATRFRDEQHLTHIIRKFAERIGRRIDFASPTLDGRVADGSRIHAVLPPIALNGPVLTIRKYGSSFRQMEDLMSVNTLRPAMAYYLGAAVKSRLNIAIGGSSASGKTTTLNVLATQVPESERLVTIEELAELDFTKSHNHVIRLQARDPNVDGAGALGVRSLVREALRMRADRIVVGEARGAEMIDVLQAMRCGHDGSMTTIHASSAADVIERAVTLSLFGNVGLSETSLRRLVVEALDVIVVLARFADGSRRVVSISEPYAVEGDVRFNNVFEFTHQGYSPSGAPLGSFKCLNSTRYENRFQRMGLLAPPLVVGELR